MQHINPNYPIYISCVGEDKTIVKSFIKKLDDYDILHRDYISVKNINLISEFEKEFGRSKIVVIFYSLDYFKSPHCMNEYSLIRNNKTIKEEDIYVVSCQNFKLTDENKRDLINHWTTVSLDNQEKDYKLLKREIQEAYNNSFYLDKEKSCSIYNLQTFFVNHKYNWKINALTKELLRKCIKEENRIKEENHISKTKYLKWALIALSICISIFIISKVINHFTSDGKTDSIQSEQNSNQDTPTSTEPNTNKSSAALSQNTHYDIPDLNNPKEREKLEQTAKDQVEYFINCLERITDQNYGIDKRRRKIKDALDLFIGEGYPFKLDDIEQEAVKIEITSTTKSDTTYYIRHYLHNLCDIADKYYTYVSIKAVDVLKCSDIKQYNDTLYVCTVSFTQKFFARRGEVSQYADYTRKHVKVFLMPGYDNEGYGLVAKLGDVSASETTKIR